MYRKCRNDCNCFCHDTNGRLHNHFGKLRHGKIFSDKVNMLIETKNKHQVEFTPLSTGQLLSEVTRAYMHGGVPSTLIRRIIEGLNWYCDETDDAEDKRMAVEAKKELLKLVKKLEDQRT